MTLPLRQGASDRQVVDKINELIDGKQDYISISISNGYHNADITDDINKAVSLSISKNPHLATDGVTTIHKPYEIRIPAGKFKLSSKIVVDLYSAGSLSDREGITIKGAGKGSTFLTVDHADYAFEFIKGIISFGGMTIDGTISGAKGIRIGGEQSNSEVCYQSKFHDLEILHTAIGISINFCYDTSFVDVSIKAMSDTGTGLKIEANTTDNSNNLHFRRCHFEEVSGGGGLLVDMQSPASPGPNNVNNLITFDACHFETRAYDTMAIKIFQVRAVTFINATISRGTADSTEAETVNLIELDNADSVDFWSGRIVHNGTFAGTPPAKLVHFKNGPTEISFHSVFFSEGATETFPPLSKLYDDTNNADSDRRTWVFREISINSLSAFRRSSSIDHGETRRQFRQRVDNDNYRLRHTYTDTDQFDYDNDGFSIDPYGGTASRPFITILNGGMDTFIVDTNVQASGTCLFLIMATENINCGALVAKRAGQLQLLAAGSAVSISATPSAGFYGLNVASNQAIIEIYNNLGSDAGFTVQTVSFA